MQLTLKDTCAKLLQADKIVVTAHINPDGDALGSSLGLMHFLRQNNKDVTVMIDDDLPGDFSFLPGFAEISRPQEVKADLLVIVDACLDRIGTVGEKVKADAVLNIDHHVSNDLKADFVYLAPEKAAAAEIIYELVKASGQKISAAMAKNLYTGIATDSGFFRFSNTTASTMLAGAELIACGVKPNEVSEALEQRSFALVKGFAAEIAKTELFAEGKISGMFLSKETTDSLETTEGLISAIRVIRGVDVAVVVREIEEGVCRVSMRSKKTDVSKIAMSFAGGGHARAAGCTIYKPLAGAKTDILAAVAAALEE